MEGQKFIHHQKQLFDVICGVIMELSAKTAENNEMLSLEVVPLM